MLRTIVFTLLMLVFARCLRPSSGASNHRPGWLGLERKGWVSGFNPPAEWPVQLEREWQATGGIGYSSAIVSKVYSDK